MTSHGEDLERRRRLIHRVTTLLLHPDSHTAEAWEEEISPVVLCSMCESHGDCQYPDTCVLESGGELD